jgi:hypothetical protein
LKISAQTVQCKLSKAKLMPRRMAGKGADSQSFLKKMFLKSAGQKQKSEFKPQG